jgi:hypothetical protein
MTTKSIKLSDALKKNGKSRESVKTMSDEEIHRRALRDPDNPPLTDEELAQFRPTSQMDRMAIKRETLSKALLKTGKFRNDEIEKMSTEEIQHTLFALNNSDNSSLS